MRIDHAVALKQSYQCSLPREARFLVAGSVWRVSCEVPEILTAMREAFQPAGSDQSEDDLSVSFCVDPELLGEAPWQPPYFRGLNHLVYASYGSGGSMLLDFLGHRVIGSFSPAMAQDLVHWKRVLLPVLLGIASASIGVTPLHSACLVRDESGLVLMGASGAGKSTLALSLSIKGFSYLSDDWTYLSRDESGVRAWGLPTEVKLLPDAAKYFPQLGGMPLHISLNGELAWEVDPVEMFGVTRSLCCRPRWLVFIERIEEPRAVFERVSPSEAAERCGSQLEALPPRVSSMRESQLETIRALAGEECWVLRHGLSPEAVSECLLEFCAR